MSSSPTPAHSSSGGKSGVATIKNALMVVAAVVVVGGLYVVLNPLSWFAGGGGSTTSTTYRTQASAQCPGTVQSVSLTTTSALRVNPGHVCFFYARVDSGRVILSGPNGWREFGTEGAPIDETPYETAQAARGTAVMRYVLCPGKKHNFDTWACQ